MENQTRFDVNAAIENWRNELAAQTALSADDRRELDTHLHDLFVELKLRGLSDEESFVLARHRVGQLQKLADEFVKENPAKIWRERIFWMWAAIFLMVIWQELISSITLFLEPINIGNSPNKIMLPQLLSLSSFLIPIIAAILIAQGKMNWIFRKSTWLLSNRLRLTVALFVLVAIVATISFSAGVSYAEKLNNIRALHAPNFVIPMVGMSLVALVHPAIFALVLILLLPTKNRQTSKRA